MKSATIHQSWFTRHFVTICLVAIVLIGGLIRFAQLATLPSTLNRDEAALAYNALLLNSTGKDEWGRSWPISLESFGDYKLPGYSLLTISSFRVFGVNNFAVRVPSALAGTLLIVVGFIFARKVLHLHPLPCLFVGLTIALQPVFFFYSRMAWEANAALLFFTTAVTLLLSEFDGKRQSWLIDLISLVLLLLAIFTYNTPLLLLPFIAVAVLLQRGVLNWRKWLLPLLGIIVIFLSGLLIFSEISQQKKSITIFSDERVWQDSVRYYNSFSGISQKVLGNRYVFFGKVILQHYSSSIGPVFLVQKGGGHPWHTLPSTGHLYLVTYFLSIFGVVRLFTVLFSRTATRNTKSTALMLLFLVVSSLAPSVITVDAPHATRSLFFFFLLSVYSGVAAEWLLKTTLINQKKLSVCQLCFAVLFFVGVSIETKTYYEKYFSSYPKQSAVILKAGLGEQLNKMETRLSNSPDQVAVVDPDGFHYISVAWALKMSPNQYFASINHHLPDRIGLKYGYRVGRYRFIANREDRLPEDKHIIEWYQDIGHWVTDQSL